MAGEGGGGEADSWVPVPPGGTGTPQTTKKDGKRERAQYSTITTLGITHCIAATQQGVCSKCNTSFFLKRKVCKCPSCMYLL